MNQLNVSGATRQRVGKLFEEIERLPCSRLSSVPTAEAVLDRFLHANLRSMSCFGAEPFFYTQDWLAFGRLFS